MAVVSAESLDIPQLIAGDAWMAQDFERCETAYHDAFAKGLVVSDEEVFKEAYEEDERREEKVWIHREDIDPQHVVALARWGLGRTAILEEEARKPLEISPELAKELNQEGNRGGIGWIFSATGLAGRNSSEAAIGEVIKGQVQENAAYTDAAWKQGWDHARVSLATRFAVKVALANSGLESTVPYEKLADGTWSEYARDAVAQSNYRSFYSGYPIETINAHALLLEDDTVIPQDKAIILHTPLRNTVGQVETFRPGMREALRNRHLGVTVLFGHAPHLGARIVHMMGQHKPIERGAPTPIVMPVATPEVGRKDISLQEARGHIFFVMSGNADAAPHKYRTLEQANLEAAAC